MADPWWRWWRWCIIIIMMLVSGAIRFFVEAKDSKRIQFLIYTYAVYNSCIYYTCVCVASCPVVLDPWGGGNERVGIASGSLWTRYMGTLRLTLGLHRDNSEGPLRPVCGRIGIIIGIPLIRKPIFLMGEFPSDEKDDFFTKKKNLY